MLALSELKQIVLFRLETEKYKIQAYQNNVHTAK